MNEPIGANGQCQAHIDTFKAMKEIPAIKQNLDCILSVSLRRK